MPIRRLAVSFLLSSLLLGVITASQPAGAVTITFDGQTGDVDLTVATYTESGFEFDAVADLSGTAFVVDVPSTSDDLIDMTNGFGAVSISTTRIGGGQFTLRSLTLTLENFVLCTFFIQSDKGYEAFHFDLFDETISLAGPEWEQVTSIDFALINELGETCHAAIDDIVVTVPTLPAITFDNQTTTTDLTTTDYTENGYQLSGGLVGLAGSAEVFDTPSTDDDLELQVVGDTTEPHSSLVTLTRAGGGTFSADQLIVELKDMSPGDSFEILSNKGGSVFLTGSQAPTGQVFSGAPWQDITALSFRLDRAAAGAVVPPPATAIIDDVFLTAGPAPVPDPIYVLQGGVLVGTIEPYVGALDGASNYAYDPVVNSGDPVGGPEPVHNEGQLYFYEGSDGLSLNIGFNRYEAGVGIGRGTADWTIDVWGSATDPERRLVDDPLVGELTEPANDSFVGAWDWAHRTDGGVIGELSGDQWVVRIDPQAYGGVDPLTALRAYDRSGASLVLGLGTSPADTIVLSPTFPLPQAVPALPPMAIGMLAAALALVGMKARPRGRRSWN